MIKYSILDPTGNITALVTSAVDVARQPSVAADIMARHAEVEQVGFVTFPDAAKAAGDAQPAASAPLAALRMAGGEFCGNATMSAAFLCALAQRGSTQRSSQRTPASTGQDSHSGAETMRLRVSGAADPVAVWLEDVTDTSCAASVQMPPAIAIEDTRLSFDGITSLLPLVRMEGISHLIVEANSPFYSFLQKKDTAEAAVRAWCDVCAADGLGLMFVSEKRTAAAVPEDSDAETCRDLTPLVYVPAAGTTFWENSCASGSAAAGMYLTSPASGIDRSATPNAPVPLTFREPGGTLRVTHAGGTTLLHGSVRILQRDLSF